MNDRHHPNHGPQEAQEKADQVVAAMESDSTSSSDEFQQLGEAVRQSSHCALPESSQDLRELVTANLDDTVPTTAPRKPEVASNRGSRRWVLWGTTAAALLAVGATLYFGPPKLGVELMGGVKLEPLPLLSGAGDEEEPSHSTSTRLEDAKKNQSEAADRLNPEQVARHRPLSPPTPGVVSGKPLGETTQSDSKALQSLDVDLASSYSSAIPMPVTTNEKLYFFDTNRDGQMAEFRRAEIIPTLRQRIDPSGTRDIELRVDYGVDGRYQGGGGGSGGRSIQTKKRGEQYDPIHENPFLATKGAGALSTFSIDVDTAAYANMRRYLTQGRRVPPNAVRVEELINYFDYDYPQPEGDVPFSVNMELAACPWNDKHQLLRIGLKGKEVHRDERPAANIVFLIDVSGSMNSHDKLPLLKSGFQLMVNALNENDLVSIVTYAGNSQVVLEPTSGDQKQKINAAIENLKSGGSTNGSAGIETAYQLAQRNFIQDGNNKVILASDGDLNVGVTSDTELVKLITNKASEGVFLSVLGFGTGNLKDSKMEKLADNGNGDYSYIDGVREAHKVLVEGMSGALVTIAKDVKLQLEFNPAEVKGYRLIGYENRVLAARDFDDDMKDAGEIGAGHTVTALYELIPSVATMNSPEVPQGLKYQQTSEAPPEKTAELSDAAKSGELLTLALRYKQPDANESERIEFTLPSESKSFSSASGEFKFAASVAAFGMILRGSEHRGDATPRWVQQTASESIGQDASGYRAEFIDLVRRFSSAQ